MGSSPNWSSGFIPTATEWNNTFIGKADQTSAALTGTPTAPTQSSSDNSTKIATTAFVKSQSSYTASTYSITGLNFYLTNNVGLSLLNFATGQYIQWHPDLNTLVISANNLQYGSGLFTALGGLSVPSGPVIPHSPTGNSPTTYGALISQGDTVYSARSFQASFGLNSFTGGGDKVCLYAGTDASSGSGDAWSVN